jgi:phage tail protein X
MISKRFLVGSVTALMSIAAFYAAKPAETAPDKAVIVHAVKKGESVSLICIRYYGRYTDAMGGAVKKINPSVKDINLIFAGRKLTLPNPARPAAAPQVDTSREAALFEKKVNATQGVITCVEGKAFVTAKGTTAKKKLMVNTLVYPGDVVETGTPGRVEVIINRESVVRMKENSRLTIEAFRDNVQKKGPTRLGCALGTVWSKIRKFKDAVSRFELELPTAVAGVHGTIYQASVSTDSSAEVKVFDGEVAVKNRPASKDESAGEPTEVSGPGEVKGPSEVTMEQWTAIVRAMQKMGIDNKGNPSPVQQFAKDTSDTWEQWNEERDEQIEDIFEEEE